MSGWMKKLINRFKKAFGEGLRGKIFRLCLIVIANAVLLFAVLDTIQLQLLWRTAQDNSDSQAEMIKEQSLESLEKSTEVNLTQTARQAADNAMQLSEIRNIRIFIIKIQKNIAGKKIPLYINHFPFGPCMLNLPGRNRPALKRTDGSLADAFALLRLAEQTISEHNHSLQ